jgi:hypothetical protein
MPRARRASRPGRRTGRSSVGPRSTSEGPCGPPRCVAHDGYRAPEEIETRNSEPRALTPAQPGFGGEVDHRGMGRAERMGEHGELVGADDVRLAGHEVRQLHVAARATAQEIGANSRGEDGLKGRVGAADRSGRAPFAPLIEQRLNVAGSDRAKRAAPERRVCQGRLRGRSDRQIRVEPRTTPTLR